ncbi:hypothetical protein ACN9MZ_17135 [Pseudoduganella sp. S-14]|uniref:hypothetical protein n=1 Tax=Pseudoduganella sp. S-14 TaxID=3404065 RepID=UPI003CF5BAA7
MRWREGTFFQGWRIVLRCTEFRCQDGVRRFASTAILRQSGKRSVVFPEEAFDTREDADVDATSRARREIMAMDSSNVVGELGRAARIDDTLRESSQDRLVAAQYEISFDGLRYAFRQYRYDAFGDALRYAKAEYAKAGFVRDKTFRADWQSAYRPTDEEGQLMHQHGIVFAMGRFHYGGFRYEQLRDAVAYANAHPGL